MSTLQQLNEHYEALREFNIHAESVVKSAIGLMMIAEKLGDVGMEARFKGFLKDFEQAIIKNEIPQYEFDLKVKLLAVEQPERVVMISERRAA